MSNLEELLRTREITGSTQRIPTSKAVRNHTSEKGTNMFGLISMIQKIVSLAMKDIDVELIPDEGKIPIEDPSERIDKSYITYKVVSRKRKNEIKPRHREEFFEESDGNKRRIGNIYGQKFDCILQFNIFSSVYEEAELVMERFEEAMFSYAGFLKKNGVGEVYFLEQRTDESLDIFRQSFSIRSIQYFVEIEKTTKIYEDTIDIIGVFDRNLDLEKTIKPVPEKEPVVDKEPEDDTIKDIITNPEIIDKDNSNDKVEDKEEEFIIEEVIVSDLDYSGINKKK